MRADPKLLQELLDAYPPRLDELLALVTLEEIADAWCRYQTRPHINGVEDDDPDWWAVELVMDSHFLEDEPRVRAIIDLLADRAPDDDVLGVVAAGPLEDFVKTADEDRLCWIVQRANESRRFRQALGGVWVWGLPPEAFARVEEAAGAPLARPKDDVVIEFVPGDLPETVHIKRNGVTVAELEAGPGGVEAMIEIMRLSL